MSDIMMTDDTINFLGCKGANLVYTTHANTNVKRTLDELHMCSSAFYRWYRQYLEN
jgi:hypothetical protein